MRGLSEVRAGATSRANSRLLVRIRRQAVAPGKLGFYASRIAGRPSRFGHGSLRCLCRSFARPTETHRWSAAASVTRARNGTRLDNPVYKAALAYQTTAALVAAVKLDIFSLVGAGSNTTNLLSLETAASVRGLRILCDYLTVIGLLTKEDSTYNLTPAAKRYLDSSSPAAVASSIDFFAAPEMISLLLNDPVSYVRHGGAIGLGSLSPDHPIWVRFAKAVVPFAAPTAKRVAVYVSALQERPSTVLDIAAGHGLYGIEVARVCVEAFVTAVDWGEVLTVARANAKKAKVDDRYHTIPGNAFDVDWGTGSI